MFASPSANENDVLPWSRAQQAAFLIFIGIQLRDAVRSEHGEWAEAIRAVEPRADAAGATDPAFASAVSLLATDIGIRGLLYATNDLCCHRSQDLELANWVVNDSAEPDTAGISAAVKSLDNTKVGAFLGAIAERLARFDWRSWRQGRLVGKVRVKHVESVLSRHATISNNTGYRRPSITQGNGEYLATTPAVLRHERMAVTN